jgi:CRISPR-associated protein Cas1
VSGQMPVNSSASPAPEEDPLLVPARMLNEWVYCRRLAFLEWVQGEWAENADTTQGRRAHLRSEKGPAPTLPAPHLLTDRDEIITRRLLLGSPALGLTAEIDVLEAEDGRVTPVDIKKGSRPHIEEAAYMPERVQVCAQGLLLREAGYTCDEGAIWFAASRERVRIVFTDELIAATKDAITGLRESVEAGVLPPPLDHSPKCNRCSLLTICLPDEINWFRRGDVPRTPPPPARPALPLYVETPGAKIGKSAEVLTVKIEDAAKQEIPLDEISELVLAGPVSISTPALHELLRRNIPVAWMSSGYWFLGSTGGQGPRSAAIRTAQYTAAADPQRRFAFASSLVLAKIRNQRTILRRNWRGLEPERSEILDRMARVAAKVDTARDTAHLLGLEGEAAAIYFRAFPSLFTTAISDLPEFRFANRNRRPPADPVNACLSLSYALLTRTWVSSLSIVGLDPWKGLFHVERPGRPALALDMIEPWRPILADSVVLMALNNGEIGKGDFVSTAGGCNLKPNARKALIAAYERRLDQEATHPVFGYTISIRRMLHVQARLLARFLMGELPDYPHYLPR